MRKKTAICEPATIIIRRNFDHDCAICKKKRGLIQYKEKFVCKSCIDYIKIVTSGF